MIFILPEGLYTSIASRPQTFNPASYFIDMMRMVVLEGSTLYKLYNIWFHFLAAGAFGVVLSTWTIINYKKRS